MARHPFGLDDYTWLEFKEKEGQLWFKYREQVSSDHGYRIFKAEGVVPPEIIAQGEDAIKQYTNEQIELILTPQKEEARKWEEYEKNPNFPLETTHEGVTLKGRIISTVGSTLRVRLEEPYQGEQGIHFGYAAAM